MRRRRVALLSILPVLAACPPDDDDDGSPPPLACDDPQDPAPPVIYCGFHEGIPQDWNWSSFRSEDGAIEVLIVRDWVDGGVGESAIYALMGFGVVRDGCLACIDDESGLDYENTHHNWNDVAWAEAEGETLRFGMTYGPLDDDPMGEWGWRFLLSGVEPGDHEAVLWGPIELEGLDGQQPPA